MIVVVVVVVEVEAVVVVGAGLAGSTGTPYLGAGFGGSAGAGFLAGKMFLEAIIFEKVDVTVDFGAGVGAGVALEVEGSGFLLMIAVFLTTMVSMLASSSRDAPLAVGEDGLEVGCLTTVS